MKQHKMEIEIAARSETGYVRNENQDRMSGLSTPSGHLYIVADGMGGHKGGAIAAELTIQGLQKHIAKMPASATIDKIIGDAFKKTNKTVYDKAHSGNEATEGMGSTAVLLLLKGNLARIAHVGDSRAYLFRNNRLMQLTRDHTVVQKMVEAGMLKPEEAAHHPDANILERAIGSKPEVVFDICNEFTLLDGDAILLCSDGLSGYASNEEIEFVLQNSTTVQEIPDSLILLSLEDKGSEDNVTVQFIQYGTRKFFPPLPNKHKENFGYRKKKISLFTLVIALIIIAGISAGLTFYFVEKKWSRKTTGSGSFIEKPEKAVKNDTKPMGQETAEHEENLQPKAKYDIEETKKNHIPNTEDKQPVSQPSSTIPIKDPSAEQDSPPVPSVTGTFDRSEQEPSAGSSKNN